MKIFAKLRTNFLTGALVIIPLLLTFWVFYFIVDKLNSYLLEPIMDIFHTWVPAVQLENLAKLAVFLVLLVFLILVGMATRIIILRNIFGFGEKILYKVPMINIVYRTIKEISFAFLVQQNTIFQKVALIEYPRKGLYQLGFIVSEAKGEAQEKIQRTDVINIFLPTTPNPTSGMLVFVPKEDVIPLDMSVAEGMKLVISGGAVVPKQKCIK